MSDPINPPVIKIVQWVWHADTATLTAEIQQDGQSVIVATIPAAE